MMLITYFLTGWIDGNLAPVRPGVYRRKWGPGRTEYAYWTGKLWRRGHDTVKAARWETAASSHQPGRKRNNSGNIPWRGLTQEWGGDWKGRV